MNNLNSENINKFVNSITCRKRVAGLTHQYYKYPARFSPQFARNAIQTFTQPGDYVFDPFMGGGTSLVEAASMGRYAIGLDISNLAVFLSEVKTTILSQTDIHFLNSWFNEVKKRINIHNPSIKDLPWIDAGYQRNINSKKTWPIKKAIELSLPSIDELNSVRQKNFARCLLLNTAQWSFDCRKVFPNVNSFRQRLDSNFKKMLKGNLDFANASRFNDDFSDVRKLKRADCINCSATDILSITALKSKPIPKLVLTSPPYPGVHVLYHRWQLMGGKETPAPFWIANLNDGYLSSFYTMGNRKQLELATYYEQLFDVFFSLSKIVDAETYIVQLIGFSNQSWQLNRYLDVLEQAGFIEIKLNDYSQFSDGRLWRSIPNRKWYANSKGQISSSKEVVLLHRLK
jgi:hypothetical protein